MDPRGLASGGVVMATKLAEYERCVYLQQLAQAVIFEVESIDCFHSAGRDRNKLIFRLCVFHGLAIDDAAKRFRMTAERIRQIVTRIKRQLRYRLRWMVCDLP